MPSLMWECACGADNPAAAHSCTTCGRVPGLAPDPVQEERSAPKGGRRRGLPFSAASGRRSSRDGRERALERPPAGAPGPDRDLLRETGVVSSESFSVPPAPAESVVVETTPGLQTGPRPEPAPAPEAGAAPEPAPAPEAGAAPEPAKRKPSFFDPEPEPADAPTGAQRRRKLVTPTAIAAIVAIVIALGLLVYVIANTGNSKPPPQAGMGAPVALTTTA